MTQLLTKMKTLRDIPRELTDLSTTVRDHTLIPSQIGFLTFLHIQRVYPLIEAGPEVEEAVVTANRGTPERLNQCSVKRS